MAEKSQYITFVATEKESQKQHLCMLELQHGVFLYTGYKDEDGNTFWHYQQPWRHIESKVTYPKYNWESAPTVKPTVNKAAQEHGFDLDASLVRRSYESLKNLYTKALQRIAELETRNSELRDGVTEGSYNVPVVEYK